MKKLLFIALLLLSGCSTMHYQEYRAGMKPGITFVGEGCEKLVVGTGVKYTRCF